MNTTNRESALAHRLLDGLSGIEIGGSAYNPFNIPGCKNVDFTADTDTVFKQEERRLCGTVLPVDVVARGDKLPFADASLDYVLSSHVLEHFFDPLGAILEWQRVLRPGGILFMIVPHRDRTADSNRPRTLLSELIDRHAGRLAPPSSDDESSHKSVWATNDVVSIVEYLGFAVHTVQDVDDKVGNGFTIVCTKLSQAADTPALGTSWSRHLPVTFSLDAVAIDADAPQTVAGSRDVSLELRATSSLRLSGWAVNDDSAAPVSGLLVLVDGRPIRTAYYGAERPDVAELLANPSLLNVGFSVGLHPPWSNGEHAITIRAFDRGTERYADLGVGVSVRVLA